MQRRESTRIRTFKHGLLSMMVIFMASVSLAVPPQNYTQLDFEDNFDGTSLNAANWTVGLEGPSGNGTPGGAGQYLLGDQYDSYITAEDVIVSGGNLYLQVQKRNYTGTDPAGNYNYTGGWIQSMEKMSINRGYVEFRAQFPKGLKMWPAVWMIADDLIWGPEWDLWEYFGYRSDIGNDKMANSLFTGTWQNPKWNAGWIHNFDATYDNEAWHVYGFEWTATDAIWWVDGEVTTTLAKDATLDPGSWPDEGMYFVLNNATQSAASDGSTVYPNNLVVDYFRVYSFVPDAIAPAAPTGLAATAGGGTISLDWDDNAEPDLEIYGIWRSTTAGGPYTHLLDTAGIGSEYTDGSVNNGTTYYYVVTAIDSSGNESAYSAEASATPTAGGPQLLIGGTVLNGDFNNPALDATFDTLANWGEIGSGPSSMNATQNSGDTYDGSMHAIMGYLEGVKIYAIDTGHTLAEGDVFDVGYVWKDGWLWNDGSDRVRVALYTTQNNSISGSRTDLVVDMGSLSTQNDTYETVDHNAIYTATAGVAGKKLFVALDASIGGEAYGPLDNFELIVTPSGGGGNNPPAANAGNDQTVTDSDDNGSESVTLDGSGSSDSDGTITSYVWKEGPSQIATGVNPSVSLSVGVHTITLTVTDNEGATGADTVIVTVDAIAGPADDVANADLIVSGSVSGNYVATQVSDDSYQSITETQSGGKPSNRHSYLEHKWTINVAGGNSVIFYVEAHKTANSEGDDFVFAYSTDNVNFTDMVTVTKTADNDTAQQFTLPNSLSGTVYIRVKDTDQSQGNRTLDTVYIDEMYVRSDGEAPPNQAPSFNSNPVVEANATVDAAYSSTLANDASDPESDPMTFSKVSGSTWLSVAADGTLSGTPGAGDLGLNSFTVQVDATGGSDTATMEITVEEQSAPLPGEAGNPDPISRARNVSVTPILSWSAGSDAVSHDVYFGTDAANLAFQGNQTGTTFSPGTLANKVTYYWRIDEVNSAGTTTGIVWQFKTVR